MKHNWINIVVRCKQPDWLENETLTVQSRFITNDHDVIKNIHNVTGWHNICCMNESNVHSILTCAIFTRLSFLTKPDRKALNLPGPLSDNIKNKWTLKQRNSNSSG